MAKRQSSPSQAPAQSTDAFLRLVVKLVDAEGLGVLTTRKLSDHLGQSPMAIYAHAKSMPHLHALVTADCLRRLTEFIQLRVEKPQDDGRQPQGAARLEAALIASVDWAQRHPALFQSIMQPWEAYQECKQPVENAMNQVMAQLRALFVSVADALHPGEPGRLVNLRPEQFLIMAQGLGALVSTQRFGERDRLWRAVVASLANMLYQDMLREKTAIST